MSYSSNFNLNQRISFLEYIINQIAPSLPLDLDNILANGNSAGTYDIDLNNNDLLNVNNIDVNTINGAAYPPSAPSSSLFNYKATTTSQAPPVSNGRIEWNNAVQASATELYVSHLDDNGDDIEVLLGLLSTGFKILIQDQATSANYQQWTITSVSVVSGQYVQYGVSLDVSTHSFSNNDPILLIVQSANQNLSQVLAVGNDAGGQDITNVDNINLNTINGSAYPPAPVASTLSAVLTAGNSAGSNSINMNTNAISNISTATAKTSVVVDNAVVGANSTLTQSNLTINATGLSNAPVLTLNQSGVGNAGLFQEVYNQRTATTGVFNTMSFFAKSSTGVKREYARIDQEASTITNGAENGRLDLSVMRSGVITDFLSLNGTANQVNCLRALDLNSNQINNIFNANTTFFSTLAPQKVSYLTTNDSTPTSNDPNMRQVYINTGVPPSLQSVGTAPLGSWSPITASATYNGNTYIGTNDGQIYYTNDPNGSWTSLGVLLNGPIYCFKEFNGDLYFGGSFTSDFNTSTTYNNIGRITNTPAITNITWSNIGQIGLNGAVLCFETYNNYLYVGGNFFQDGGSLVPLNYLAIVDTTNNIYNTNNNTTDGFNNIVRSICNDTGSNRFIIGGDFSTFTSSGTAFSQSYYTQIDFDSSVSYNTIGFFTLSPSLNGAVSVSVKDTNTGAIILGGNFTSISPYTDYMFEMLWNGSSYQPQNFSYSAPSSAPTFLARSSGTSAVYWGDGSVLYSSNGWSQTSPVGGAFSTAVYSAWAQDNFATNSSSQNPIVLYYRNTSNSINITLNSPLRTQGGGYYTNNINLANNGNAVELIWNSSNATWYLLSNEGATFS